MKKFFVRKIFPYDPTFGGKYTKFKGYSLITSLESDPPTSREVRIKLAGKISNPIFCSTLKRAIQTANFIADKENIMKINKISELKEIKFCLDKLVSEEEYQKYGSNRVRERFIAYFINDRLTEKRSSIKRRIMALMKRLAKLPEGNYLLISHSFLMKILDSYLKDRQLFQQPEHFRELFDSDKKTYEFGGGFDFTL